MTNRNPNTVFSNQSHGSRSIFARIMSTENIQVIFDPNSKDAWFDTKTRVLSMPNWKGMTPEVYDLLLSHEVSHALHTPYKDWVSLTDELVGKNASDEDKSVARQYMNIIEDARIERLIKAKYPGLARDYHKGYNWLLDNGFMGDIKSMDMNSLSLVDRINIHFKAGSHCGITVPFTDEEQQIVDMVENSATFDDVVKVTRLIWDQDSNRKKKDKKGQSSSTSGQGEGEGKEHDGEDEDSINSSNNNHNERNNLAPKSPMTVKNMEKFLNKRRDQHHEDVPGYLPQYDLSKIVVPSKMIYSQLTEAQNSCTKCSGLLQEMKGEFATFVSEANSTVDNMVKVFLTKKAARAHHRSQEAKTGTLDMNKLSTYKWNDDLFKHFTIKPNGKNHGFIMYLDWSGSMGGMVVDVIKQMYILTSFFRRVNVPFDVYAFSSSTPSEKYHSDYHSYHNDAFKKMEERQSGVKIQTNHGEPNTMVAKDFYLLQFASSTMKKNEYTTAMEQLYILASTVGMGRYDNYGHNVPYPQWLGLGDTPLDDAMIVANQLVKEFIAKHKTEIMNVVVITDGSSNGSPLDHGVTIGKNTGASNKFGRTRNGEWSDPVYVYRSPTRLVNRDNGASYKIGRGLNTNVLARYLSENTGCNTMLLFLADQVQGVNVHIPGHEVCLPNGEVLGRHTNYRPSENAPKINDFWSKENFLLAIPRSTDYFYGQTPDAKETEPGFTSVFAIKIARKQTEDTFSGLDMNNTTYTRLKTQFVKSLQKKIVSRGLVNRMVEAMAKHT